MRKMLWAGALMSLALMTSTAATGADKQLAVGSAKTDVDVAVVTEAPEHASFSAHSTGNGCEATGHVSYKGFLFGPAAPPVDVEVDVTQLVIAGNAEVRIKPAYLLACKSSRAQRRFNHGTAVGSFIPGFRGHSERGGRRGDPGIGGTAVALSSTGLGQRPRALDRAMAETPVLGHARLAPARPVARAAAIVLARCRRRPASQGGASGLAGAGRQRSGRSHGPKPDHDPVRASAGGASRRETAVRADALAAPRRARLRDALAAEAAGLERALAVRRSSQALRMIARVPVQSTDRAEEAAQSDLFALDVRRVELP